MTSLFKYLAPRVSAKNGNFKPLMLFFDCHGGKLHTKCPKCCLKHRNYLTRNTSRRTSGKTQNSGKGSDRVGRDGISGLTREVEFHGHDGPRNLKLRHFHSQLLPFKLYSVPCLPKINVNWYWSVFGFELWVAATAIGLGTKRPSKTAMRLQCHITKTKVI